MNYWLCAEAPYTVAVVCKKVNMLQLLALQLRYSRLLFQSNSLHKWNSLVFVK